MGVILLNKHSAIGRDRDSNRRDDVGVLSEQRDALDVRVMNIGRESGLFAGCPREVILTMTERNARRTAGDYKQKEVLFHLHVNWSFDSERLG